MKDLIKLHSLCLVILLITLHSCKKHEVPTVTTSEVTNITGTTATSGGTITDEGSGTVVERGICWSKGITPTINDNYTIEGGGMGSFVSNMTFLDGTTTYYVRAYAKNKAGIGYGMTMSFTTLLADIDGNIYNYVTIGNQIWMKENLKTTRYSDRTNIPLTEDNTTWSTLTTPGYCWYDNNEVAYKVNYGALYNWYAVNTGKLCPTGWHVPSDNDWKILEIFYGMTLDDVNLGNWRGTDQGTQMKANSSHTPPWDGTDTYGFTAIPGGYREATNGEFYSLGTVASFWTTSPQGWGALLRYLGTGYTGVLRGQYYKTGGYSVRCIKD